MAAPKLLKKKPLTKQKNRLRLKSGTKTYKPPSLKSKPSSPETIPLPKISPKPKTTVKPEIPYSEYQSYLENQKPGLYPLLVRNISAKVKHKMLFNLFSLYGNIDKIFVETTKLEAVVYYETEFNQIMATHYLDGTPVFEKKIEITKIGKTKSKMQEREDRKRGESKAGSSDVEFFSSKQKTINKPNNILYIFNLSKNVTLRIIKGTVNVFVRNEIEWGLEVCMFSRKYKMWIKM